MRRLLPLLLLPALLFACMPKVDLAGYPCETDGDCPSGVSCLDGFCGGRESVGQDGVPEEGAADCATDGGAPEEGATLPEPEPVGDRAPDDRPEPAREMYPEAGPDRAEQPKEQPLESARESAREQRDEPVLDRVEPARERLSEPAVEPARDELEPSKEPPLEPVVPDEPGPADSGPPSDALPDGHVCRSGESRECYSGDPKYKGVGECKAGRESCSGGKWDGRCVGAVRPAKGDTCNGKDDDCDGYVDNGYVEKGMQCTVAGATGPCANGTYTACVGGKLTCTAPKPAPEICNKQDDDCDGQVDEAYICNEVVIPAGTFMTGSPAGEAGRRSDEGPQHQVTLTRGFHIWKYETTQGAFNTLMGYNPSQFASCGTDCPVEGLNWHEATAFCRQDAQGRFEGTERLGPVRHGGQCLGVDLGCPRGLSLDRGSRSGRTDGLRPGSSRWQMGRFGQVLPRGCPQHGLRDKPCHAGFTSLQVGARGGMRTGEGHTLLLPRPAGHQGGRTVQGRHPDLYRGLLERLRW